MRFVEEPIVPVDMSREAREDRAVQDVARRTDALRTRFMGLFATIGAAVGIVGYFVARELQFRILGVNWVYVSVVVGFGAPFVAMAYAGRAIGNRVARARRSAWIGDAARVHQVSEQDLLKTMLLADGISR